MIRLLIVGVSMSSGFALAQTSDELALRLQSAKQSYFDGNHSQALGRLQGLANELTDPSELADCHVYVGMSQFALGDEAAARAAFETAVRHSPDLVPQEELFPTPAFTAFREVRSGLVGRISVRTNPPGASATIAGREVGTTPYLGTVLAGELRVRVELDDYHRYEGTVEVAPGEIERVEVTMRMTEEAIKRLTEGGPRKGSRKLAYGILGGAAAGGAAAALVSTGSSRETGVPVTRTFQNNVAPFQGAGPFIADVGADGTLSVELSWDNPNAALFVQVRVVSDVFETLREVEPTGATETRFSIPVQANTIYQLFFQNFSQEATIFTLVINFPG